MHDLRKRIIYLFFALWWIYTNAQDPAAVLTLKNIKSINQLQPESIKKKKIYVLGEFHYLKRANELSCRLFRSLSSGNRKKLFFVEGGKSFEYSIHKLRGGSNYFLYKKNFRISFTKTKNLKNFFRSHSKYLINDTNVVYRSFDIENSFNYAISALYDILRTEKKANFENEITYFNKNFKANKTNLDLRPVANWYVSTFYKDTVSYVYKLSPVNFYFYSGIISDLKLGLMIDSIEWTANGETKTFRLREEIMFQNFVRELDTANYEFAFVQTGLMHTFDSLETFNNISPWISFAEMLKKKFGTENICKIGTVSLNESSYSFNNFIYSPSEIKTLSLNLKDDLYIVDLDKIKPQIKTTYNYSVLLR
jgi:hypothetical protein